MRRTIFDPAYVYVPMSEERRAKLREAHRKRLGNKEGHHQLYGVQVPDNIFPDVKKYILALRRKGVDLVTLNLVTRLFIQQKWLISDKQARIKLAAALLG